MSFEFDQQTASDLDIFGDSKHDLSLFQFLNRTETNGGAELLMEFMRHPLNDYSSILFRQEIIEGLSLLKKFKEFENRQVKTIAYYTNLNTALLSENKVNSIYRSLSYKFKTTNDFYQIKSGIELSIRFLRDFNSYLNEIKLISVNESLTYYLSDFVNLINQITRELGLQKTKLGGIDLIKYDSVFRENYKNQMNQILQKIYEFDVYQSLAKIFLDYNCSNPVFNHNKGLKLKGFWHPMLKNASSYNLEYANGKNLIFLTGPNMAGKSTFLKSVAINFYLAHLGFPVFAKEMKLSIADGLLTSINLSDNLKGHQSHFLTEVTRVKKAAEFLKSKKKILVIFDELFRGTNVKDAFEGSKLVIENLTEVSSSFYLISTHIVEISTEIRANSKVQFQYLECIMDKEEPKFTYQLRNGISEIRLGTHILTQEKVIELLQSAR